MAEQPFLKRVARWVLEFDGSRMSPEVIDKAKLLLLDGLGCALTGCRSRVAAGTLASVELLGGAEQATLLGTKIKTSVVNATLANTVFIRSLEINDIMGNDPTDGAKLGGHPSDNLSTVLAFGEWQKSCGKEALTCMAIAYEIFGRMQRLLDREQPWDHTTAHAFASAAVAGRLMGLDEDQLANALGLAAGHCTTLGTVRRGAISDGKFMASALMAQLGANAAVLASNGVTGPVGAFEDHDRGFKRAVMPDADHEEWIRPMDSRFMIEGVTIKAYPSLDTGQALVEAAVQMSRLIDGRVDEIERIDVQMTDIPMVAHQIADPDRRHPKLQAAATHSFYFLAAAPLIDGVLTPSTFEDGEPWLDPEVMALMDKVSLGVDGGWLERAPGGMPCSFKVSLKDGTSHLVEVLYAPGHQHNMMTEEQVVAKMANNTGGQVDGQMQGRIAEACRILDYDGFTVPDLI